MMMHDPKSYTTGTAEKPTQPQHSEVHVARYRNFGLNLTLV